CFFFFFQAEDGIRDRNVTGVQTCALPISPVGIDSPDSVIQRISLTLGVACCFSLSLARERNLSRAPRRRASVPRPRSTDVRTARSEERRVGREAVSTVVPCMYKQQRTERR